MENRIITRESLAAMIDHTYLKADAVSKDLEKLCREAKEYHFKMVAINSCWSSFCKKQLEGTPVHVGAAISFPLGQTSMEAKLFETRDAIENGADEIDYVIHIGRLKERDYDYIQREMEGIVSLCREHKVISKVIFENCYLTKEEIQVISDIAKKVQPDFIKTSTGFGTGGARAEDVRLMKDCVQDQVKVKAAGGIRSLEACIAMMKAGAERIGTSSGILLLEELEKEYGEKGLVLTV